MGSKELEMQFVQEDLRQRWTLLSKVTFCAISAKSWFCMLTVLLGLRPTNMPGLNWRKILMTKKR